MESVGLNQLKTVCNLYLEVEYPYFEELREAFYLLDICGCRIEELFHIERWSWISGDIVTLQPQKNNLPRTITLNSFTQNFKSCIIYQSKPFLGRTSSQLQFLFRKLNPYIPIYSGGREISLYCYRYKHIWEAKDTGSTNEEIMQEMGHRTVTPILLYLAAQINSTYYIEPYNPDPIPTDHIDIITNPIIFTGVGHSLNFQNPINNNQYTVSLSLSNLPNDTIYPLCPYRYDIQEKSIHSFITKNITTASAYFYIISSYTSPTFSPMLSQPHLNKFNFVFVISENLVISGNNRIGSVSVKYYFNGLFINQVNIPNATYPLTNCLYFNLNGRRRSNNTYQYQKIFTLNSLYFWNRILTDAEILALANL